MFQVRAGFDALKGLNKSKGMDYSELEKLNYSCPGGVNYFTAEEVGYPSHRRLIK